MSSLRGFIEQFDKGKPGVIQGRKVVRPALIFEKLMLGRQIAELIKL